MNKLSAFLTVWLMASVPAPAANPLVRFPTGDARWTIEVTYPKTPPAGTSLPDNRMVKAQVTRLGPVRQDRIWWTKSGVTEVWVSEKAKLRVYQDADNGAVYVIPFADSTMTVFVPREFDEDLFQWVTAGLLVGDEDIDGRPCHVYAGNVSRTLAFPGLTEKRITLPPMPHKAWIDAQTGRPVALDTGFAYHRFLFEDAPAGPLIVPEKLKTELERYLADITPSKRLQRLQDRAAGR